MHRIRRLNKNRNSSSMGRPNATPRFPFGLTNATCKQRDQNKTALPLPRCFPKPGHRNKKGSQVRCKHPTLGVRRGESNGLHRTRSSCPQVSYYAPRIGRLFTGFPYRTSCFYAFPLSYKHAYKTSISCVWWGGGHQRNINNARNASDARKSGNATIWQLLKLKYRQRYATLITHVNVFCRN